MMQPAHQHRRLYGPFIVFSWMWAWVLFFNIDYFIPYRIITGGAADKIQYIFHFLTRLEFGPLLLTTELILACLILVAPKHKIIVYLSFVLCPIIQYLEMPNLSNHHIMVTFFSVGLAATYLVLAVKEKNLSVSSKRFYLLVAPIGRCLLIIMYIFGIFHKINSAFLDPSVSCAVALWQQAPLPHSLQMAHWAHYCAIYGTFVIEGLCILLLLGNDRSRYYGVLLGVSFHLFLAINGFQTYLAFSTLAIALHFLFLPDTTLVKFKLRKWHFKPRWLFLTLRLMLFPLLFVLFFTMAYFVLANKPVIGRIIYLFLGLPLLCFTAQYGYPENPKQNTLKLKSPSLVLNLIPLLFFINCLSPYFGLKTGQSLAMFSNLTVEEGHSNHLLIRELPYLFNYTRDYVILLDSDDAFLKALAKHNLRLQKIYFDRMLRNRPNNSITFKYQGKTYHYSTIAQYLKEGHTHTLFEEKFLVCGEYDPRTPRACSLMDQIHTGYYKQLKEVNDGY